MIITLEEMKQYLRVDYDDDDNLIETFIAAAEKLCADVARISVDELHDICDDHSRRLHYRHHVCHRGQEAVLRGRLQGHL